MDRATENLAIRVLGAVAITTLPVHAAFEAPGHVYPGLLLAPIFLGNVVASWALCRLDAKRRALHVVTVGAGALPVVAFLLAVPQRPWTSLELSLHGTEAVLGLATLAVGGYLLHTR